MSYRAVFYISKTRYLFFRAALIRQGLSVSSWIRLKIDEEIKKWEEDQQSPKRKKRRKVFQELTERVLP